MDSVMGKVGRFVSSRSSVIVKTPVTASAAISVVNGALALVNSPMSEEAVEETMSMS
jgi:hypothetical protein